ncbi:MAG: ATP-binding protein [Clostridia bacterium]|nr:ATP-binding protein [Clostridia bacterium]
MVNEFYGRDHELATLKEQYESKAASFVIIYGRRRVGKTTLINKFLEGKQDYIYFEASEGVPVKNLEDFKNLAADFTHNELLRAAKVTWRVIFEELAKYKTDTRKIIVLDEFQYLGMADRTFISEFQKIWDHVLSTQDVMLIICGSLISMMVSQTMTYSTPLYGRRTSQIVLKQLPFSLYQEFFDGRSRNELIPYYAVTGGVPKYIKSFRTYPDIYESIERNLFDPDGYLFIEPEYLLGKEVREIGSYFSLLNAIAQDNRKMTDIASCMNIEKTVLPKYLDVLQGLDLIEREIPIGDDPKKSKRGLYRITDNYFAFWFRFIYPMKPTIGNDHTNVMTRIRNSFVPNHVAFVYEDICKQKMWQLSRENAWDFHLDNVGRYWGAAIGETDIVGVDRLSGNLVLGECKYSVTPKDLTQLHSLQSKADSLMQLTKTKKVQYIIFCPSGFTERLLDEAKNNKDLILIQDL